MAFAAIYGISGVLCFLAMNQARIDQARSLPVLNAAIRDVVTFLVATLFSVAAWILARERNSANPTHMLWPFLASCQFVLIFLGLTVIYYRYMRGGFATVVYLQTVFGAFQLVGLLGMWIFRPIRNSSQ
ncbi:MAG: hypothetical protein JNK87_01430 [Bryobacterales bacterium]|nr:hypothetical protein [Bryobacterales bacterium]